MSVVSELGADDPRLTADVYPLLVALRPQLTPEAFETLMSEGVAQGLRALVARDGPDRCVGAALYG